MAENPAAAAAATLSALLCCSTLSSQPTPLDDVQKPIGRELILNTFTFILMIYDECFITPISSRYHALHVSHSINFLTTQSSFEITTDYNEAHTKKFPPPPKKNNKRIERRTILVNVLPTVERHRCAFAHALIDQNDDSSFFLSSKRPN